MAKYLLVSFKTCPWVQRAAIVLREKKIEFEFRHIEPDNRPDWFLAISPHKKVPVLRIDESVSLFESNAIAEYLDETVAPRLHPEDPVERAVNRAWTDYVPTFAEAGNRDRLCRHRGRLQQGGRKDPGAVRAPRAGAGEAGRWSAFQRRPVLAGRRRLRAVSAALFLPGPDQEDRPHREIPAAQGMGRNPDRASVDTFLSAGRVRGPVPPQRQAPQQMGVAVHRERQVAAE